MKALVLYTHGDNSAFKLEEDFQDPVLAEYHVIIRVRATALNYHDIFTRRGMPGITLPFPMVLGLDIAGEIIAVGEKVTKWKIGDRVLVDPINRTTGGLIGETEHGGLAELCRVPEDQLVKLPHSINFIHAAALPVAYSTAFRMINHIGQVQPGEKILILGASGGVGVCCVQLAKLAGAYVIACAGDTDKAQQLREIGADDVILYMEEDFLTAIFNRYGKPSRHRGKPLQAGVDVVVNFTGGDTWQKSLRSLRQGGRLLTCGATAGFDPVEDLRYIWTYELQIHGSNAWEREDLLTILNLVEQNKLKVIIDSCWPLIDACKGFELLEKRKVFGKVIVQS